MTLKDNTKLRANLTAILIHGPVDAQDLPECEPIELVAEQPLTEAVLENYERYKSITKVSKVLSRYYGHHIPQYSVSRILKDNGVKIKTTRPSIYDSQL